MSKSNFIIDPNEFDDQSLCKSPKSKTNSQMIAYINVYYKNNVVIPQELESEYMGMLSCIEDILKDQEVLKEPWKSLSCLNRDSEYYIPIKLVDEKELPDDPIKEDGTISPDTLGAYRSWDDEQQKPIILLWPNKILEVAKDIDMDAKLICKKVIIHEFAHALMDPTNWKSEKDFAPQQKNQGPKITSDADRFMEESLANMLTLKYFHEVAKEEFDPVEDFIAKRQPAIYRFGITQFELNTDWTKWRDYKANKTPDFWSYWAGILSNKMKTLTTNIQ